MNWFSKWNRSFEWCDMRQSINLSIISPSLSCILCARVPSSLSLFPFSFLGIPATCVCMRREMCARTLNLIWCVIQCGSIDLFSIYSVFSFSYHSRYWWFSAESQPKKTRYLQDKSQSVAWDNNLRHSMSPRFTMRLDKRWILVEL